MDPRRLRRSDRPGRHRVQPRAFHAANFTLKHAHLFPHALCMSGSSTPARGDGWGERGEAVYFNNPVDYVGNLHGDHLNWLRSQVYLLLVCGQGMWEDTTGSLDGTRTLAAKLADKGIPHDLDLWGHDSAHDWPWWRRQFAHHCPILLRRRATGEATRGQAPGRAVAGHRGGLAGRLRGDHAADGR